jgi:hypothetical protein
MVGKPFKIAHAHRYGFYIVGKRLQEILHCTTRERFMKKSHALGGVAISAMFWGCESQQQMVDQMQPNAVQVAQKRGQFELNCPAATAEVLSKEMIQTPAPTLRYSPPERAEYTVGVSGCGKRATYLVVCAQGGTGCVAGAGRNAAAQ